MFSNVSKQRGECEAIKRNNQKGKKSSYIFVVLI